MVRVSRAAVTTRTIASASCPLASAAWSRPPRLDAPAPNGQRGAIPRRRVSHAGAAVQSTATNTDARPQKTMVETSTRARSMRVTAPSDGLQHPHTCGREAEAQRAAQCRQDHRLREQRHDESSPRRSQREADRQLAFACDGPADQEAGDVRGQDQQDDKAADEERQESSAARAPGLLFRRDDSHDERSSLGVISLSQRLPQLRGLTGCLCDGRAGPQAPQQAEAAIVVSNQRHGVRGVGGQPDVGHGLGNTDVGGEDAGHREASAEHGQRHAEGGARADAAFAQNALADDDGAMLARLGEPAGEDLRTNGRKEAARHERDTEDAGPVPSPAPHGPPMPLRRCRRCCAVGRATRRSRSGGPHGPG